MTKWLEKANFFFECPKYAFEYIFGNLVVINACKLLLKSEWIINMMGWKHRWHEDNKWWHKSFWGLTNPLGDWMSNLTAIDRLPPVFQIVPIFWHFICQSHNPLGQPATCHTGSHRELIENCTQKVTVLCPLPFFVITQDFLFYFIWRIFNIKHCELIASVVYW